MCHFSWCKECTIRFDIIQNRAGTYRHTHRGRTDTRQPNPCDNARRRHRHRGERNQQCKVETAQETSIPYGKTNEMTITFRQNSAKFSPNWHQLFGEFPAIFRSFYTDLLSFFRAKCFFRGARAYAIAISKPWNQPWTLAVGEHIVTRTATHCQRDNFVI